MRLLSVTCAIRFYEPIWFKFCYFVESLPVRVIWHAHLQLNLPLFVGAASTFRKHRFDFTSFCPIFAHSISTNHSWNPNSAKLTHHTFLWRSEWHSPGMGSHNRPRNSFDSDCWWRRKTFSYRRKVWCYFFFLKIWVLDDMSRHCQIAIWLYQGRPEKNFRGELENLRGRSHKFQVKNRKFQWRGKSIFEVGIKNLKGVNEKNYTHIVYHIFFAHIFSELFFHFFQKF